MRDGVSGEAEDGRETTAVSVLVELRGEVGATKCAARRKPRVNKLSARMSLITQNAALIMRVTNQLFIGNWRFHLYLCDC